MVKKAQKKAAVTKKPEFNVRFAAVRSERGLTLQELADKAKVHISHIQRIEAGKSQPTVEILKRLAEALEQLPGPQREAVLLRHVAGLTLKEVSARLHCTPAATAGLLYRGRQRLQELLKGE